MFFTFKKDFSDCVLRSVSFDLKSNELVGIIGKVGSGKTSLLMAILGEANCLNGTFDVNGSIFYVTQEPWIFPGTILQNIVFGKPYHAQKFKDVICACALNEVLLLLVVICLFIVSSTNNWIPERTLI